MGGGDLRRRRADFRRLRHLRANCRKRSRTGSAARPNRSTSIFRPGTPAGLMQGTGRRHQTHPARLRRLQHELVRKRPWPHRCSASTRWKCRRKRWRCAHEVRDFIKRAPARDGVLSGRVQPGVQPRHGQAGLDRHDLAETIWRPRADRLRTLCGDRGNARRRRPVVGALHRRPAKRPQHIALRHRGAEEVLPAEDRRRAN